MKYPTSIFLSTCLLAACHSPDTALHDQLARVARDNQLIGMSVLLVCDGDIIDEYYYGLADLEAERPVDEDTRYRIASISKTVVATGLMKLYEQGLFGLDDDIGETMGYTIRNPDYPEVPITFRMLLTHTSSLQDGGGYGDFLFTTYRRDTIPGMEEILLPDGDFYTEDMWLDHEPGTYFTYCNLAYGLLGALIEKLSGKRFDVYMREEVLEPLDMEGSFNVRDIEDLHTVATLYRNSNVQADAYPEGYPEPLGEGYTLGHNGSIFGPQGSLRVSPWELSRFMLMHMNGGETPEGRLLEEATVEKMHQSAWSFDGRNGDHYGDFYNRFGLSFHRTGNPGHRDYVFPGVSMIGHAGEAYGLISEMHWDESGRFGVIFMTNGFYGEEGHRKGSRSTFYRPEEEVFDLVESYFRACLQEE